jgi:8-oxo-dGTP diphosphatase
MTEEAQASRGIVVGSNGAVAVDVVILTIRNGRLSVLLVERGLPPYKGRWALPGGFVLPNEDLDEAALRELAEETGLSQLPPGAHLEQLKTYGTPDRDPRMRVFSVAYVGLLPDLPMPVGGSDAAAARYWTIEDIKESDPSLLVFDHAAILADGVERARAKLEYTPLATAFCEESFTLSELRRVYEGTWGVSLNAANFRRKVLSTPGFAIPTGRTTVSAAGRPPQLYRRGDASLLHPAMLRPSS